MPIGIFYLSQIIHNGTVFEFKYNISNKASFVHTSVSLALIAFNKLLTKQSLCKNGGARYR